MRINEWSKYQSYKDRKPPWIRFHRSILDNYKFQMMSADARAILPMLWLLACEHKDPTSGIVDAPIEELSFRLRQTDKLLKSVFVELQAAGFIECNESVTGSLQDSNQTVSPETETETETENKKSTAEAGFHIPDQDQVDNASVVKLKKTLEEISTELYEKEIFIKVHVFKNKMIKEGRNLRAIIHTLSRCYVKAVGSGFKSETPWGYCIRIIEVENGNYNEQDHGKTS